MQPTSQAKVKRWEENATAPKCLMARKKAEVHISDLGRQLLRRLFLPRGTRQPRFSHFVPVTGLVPDKTNKYLLGKQRLTEETRGEDKRKRSTTAVMIRQGQAAAVPSHMHSELPPERNLLARAEKAVRKSSLTGCDGGGVGVGGGILFL